MIISSNLIGKLPIPDEAITRINLAWVDLAGARNLLSTIREPIYSVYLDYPSGRTKPPKPTITLDEAIELANEFNVNYFAVSNAEDAKTIRGIKERVNCEVVPKIETIKGVENIAEIAREVAQIMLDKDDLWVDCRGVGFDELVEKVRNCGVKVLELAGVVFI